MKIKLLNDGGYRGFEDVIFPVIAAGSVDEEPFDVNGSTVVYIPSDELLRIGKKTAVDGDYPFFLDDECEIVEE